MTDSPFMAAMLTDLANTMKFASWSVLDYWCGDVLWRGSKPPLRRHGGRKRRALARALDVRRETR